MAKTFVLHDETVNTFGFRMLTSGCDLTELRKNPVMLLNHNDWSLPIGRWENIRIEGTKILADPVFDMDDNRENGGAAIARKVENDFLRMASIGAWPPEEVNDSTTLWLSGQTKATVTKWKAREGSIVTIGSNHNALAFYDRKTGDKIDLNDPSALIRLMDNAKINNNPKNKHMDELNQILNLADGATPAQQSAAIRTIISDRDRLKNENTTLTERIDGLNKAAKDAQKAEAVQLIDAAVKDGRLNAAGKDNYIKLFDADFESAKASLAAIPARRSVTGQIQDGNEKNAVELADIQKKDWNTLDKEGKLVLLKDKYPDLYEQKFESRYGCKPKKA
jgi:polyhydroxyalkanoate synthesis regulator phasin